MVLDNRPKNLCVLVSGGGSNLQAVLDAANSGAINARVSAVISSNAEAFALTRAAKHNIPAYTVSLKDYKTRQQRDTAVLEILLKYACDYVILAGYLGIITEPLLNAYPDKIINIHPALLPKFGGAGFHGIAVHKAVIEAGEPYSGATVHYVDGGVDTGKIIAQERLAVLPNDTPESLQHRILNQIEHSLLVKVLQTLCKGEPL
ncbi:MAG: phosphoribosylglycinamide formyltransferase [Firmicutes bacterium]|nr:phosphoribosylglycinamide formyltransferase [Bacillota bacterium]